VTLCATQMVVSGLKDPAVSIGRPLGNTRVYVLDAVCVRSRRGDG